MNINVDNNTTYITTQNNKFKTSRVSFKFALPISSEIIANAIVLNELLVMSSKKYDSIQKLNEKLYDLYDLKVSSSISQAGRLHISEVNFSFICSEYLNENIDEQVVDFMYEILFNPSFSNEEYLKTIIEKRILEIETIYDDKMMYSIKTMIKNFDPENKYVVEVNSTVEDLKKVNYETLKDFYEMLFGKSNVTILIDGKNSETLEGMIKEKLVFNSNSTKYQYLNRFEEESNYKFISETQALNQSKFAAGIKLNIDKEDFLTFQIFNAIYGGYPFSRLFSNIREKQSLAYTVASAYSPASNMMYVYGGIGNGDLNKSDEEHITTILTALNNELDSMSSGDITDLEMSQAKSMMINSIKSAMDSQGSFQALYYSNFLLDRTFDYSEYEKRINSVVKEDVVKMASSVKFDTLFLLRGDK